MLVSIVYVNYKTAKMTADSISSVIKNTTSVDVEFFVVDNNSCDDIEEQLSGFKNIKLVKLTNNIGFGRANNCVISDCAGEYILFLNTDTLLLNDAVGVMAKTLHQNPDIGQIGANLYTKSDKPNQSFLYTHTLKSEIVSELPNCFKKRHYETAKWFNASDDLMDVGYISGAATMLRKEWLIKNGGFDKDFFMYYEDMELSVRVKRSGFRVVNTPLAKICHFGGGSSGDDTDAFVRRHKMLAESKYVYYRKVYSDSYAKKVHTAKQVLYWIYATFAPKQKRTVYKQLIINDKLAFKK